MSTWKKVLLEDANITVGTINASLTDQTTNLDANNHAAVELVVVESGELKTRTADFGQGAFGGSGTDVDVSNANLLTRLAALESAGGATDQDITIGADSGDTIVITGNLKVNGTTTTINSTQLVVDDLNVVIASGAGSSSNANGAGFEIDIDAGGGNVPNPKIQYLHSHAAFSEFQMVKTGGESSAFIAGMMEESSFSNLNATTPGVGTFGIVNGVLYVQTAS